LSPARADSDSASSLVGIILADRYRIVSRIGAGGMGQVYKAEHILMKRQCAIKVLRANLSGDPEAAQRFQREAENASQLSHPNVAQIYDFGEHDGRVYLAMEFIPGESLAALLQREGAIHPDIAADIMSQSAAALEAAHLRNVLHRDVKPDNIMLAKNPDGTYLVKLVDFGIARAMTSNERRVTRTGLVIGTPEFMSPEQIAGEELDARSDLYALALVAFQCLTGKDAFPATASKQNLILRLTSRPRTLAEVRADLPWPLALQTVFDRALAPDPAERYDSIGLFAEELAGAISSMTPSETTALYRKALDQRVVSVASRTPHSAGAISNPSAVPAATVPGRTSSRTGAGYPTGSYGSPVHPQGPDGAHPIPQAAYTTNSPFTAPVPPSTEFVPRLRRRPRLVPWLFALALAGWAYVVSTGRTAEARAMFDSVVSNVTGLIGTSRKLVESETPPEADAPRPPERRSRDAGTPSTPPVVVEQDTRSNLATDSVRRQTSDSPPPVINPPDTFAREPKRTPSPSH